MTKELARWRHRIDLGDVIQSPRGEYVLWEDYDKLARDFAALQSQWDDMHQGLLEVFGEPVRDAIELLGATEQLRSAVEPGAVLDVARWQKVQEVMCHSFDGENRTHYLRAVGRESFTDTIDRLLRERNAVNLEDYGPVIDEVAPVSKEAWDSLKSTAIPEPFPDDGGSPVHVGFDIKR
jgi:hypothetical protein